MAASQAELTRDRAAWTSWLEATPHDVFHRPEYHALPGFGHQGEPWLFAYREEAGRVFLWPYLLRPIPDTDLADVTSVYGYAGPLGCADPAFLERAWRELLQHWRAQRVVAAFTRFHPLLRNVDLALGTPLGAAGVAAAGSTVSMDLTLSIEDQVRAYQKVLRQQIRKAREAGFETRQDETWTHTSDFVRLYRETMARRQSRPEYLVDEAWVENCRRVLAGHARLFVTEYQGAVTAALLTLQDGPFLHAHLTGIDATYTVHSPLKVLLDGVRRWGAENGLRSFHLGGGLGGREDSLFQFKKRFCSQQHEFHLGRWILDAARYRDLEQAHVANLASQGYRLGHPDFFPAYRYQPTAADAIAAGDL